MEQARLKSQESIVGAKIGAEAELKQKDATAKEVLEGAKLGAQSLNKQKELAMRLKESKMRNEANVQMQKLNNTSKTDESNNGENN